MRILVVGAGISGATVANFLSKENEVVIIDSSDHISLYNKYLDTAKRKYPNMILLGRLGDYKYYDMDKAVARAMEVCRELC